MSTTEVTSWAVALSTLGPIYPFVGTEMLWFILGLIFWIAFHVWQIRFQKEEFDNEIERYGSPEDIRKYIDDSD